MSSTIAIPIPAPGNRARYLAGGLVAGLLAAAVAGAFLQPGPLLATDPAAAGEHTITVGGTGRVIVDPDIADIRLGVTVEAPTVGEARATNAEAMSAVIARLKELGIDDRDIQTTTLSLHPVYDRRRDRAVPRLIGYTLTNAVAVTVRDLDLVGDAIDEALSAGATSLNGVTFRVDDPAAAEQQARQTAMAEARAKAQTLAAAAGVSIGGVSSISESVSPLPHPVFLAGDREELAAEMATPVEPGTNEVTVAVAVVYLID